MSKWTKWRKLAEKNYWYDDKFDYEGPACYELGIGGPRYGNIKPVYAGETGNEKKRLSDYARHGSHLHNIIKKHLKQGHVLYYRAQAKRSKTAAKQMQNNLIKMYKYDWNIQLNILEED